MLAGLKKEGITIIVSTPYMDEALRCDRIALIQSGKVMGIDTPGNIRKSYSRKLYAVKHPDKYKLLLALRSIPCALSPEPFGDSIHVTLTKEGTPQILESSLAAAGLAGATVEEIVPGIEDVFLELMQREPR